MKRVIALLLLAVMLIMTVSCGHIPSNTNTDTSTNTNTDTNKDTSSSTDTSTGSKPSFDVTEDQNIYEAKTSEDGTTITYLKESIKAPYFTPYYHNYKTAVSFTFDDGYDVNTGYIVNRVFAQYGFRGTLMLNGMYLEDQGRADAWRDVVSKGYLDVGAHGYRHEDPRTLSPEDYDFEIKYCIEYLRQQFPGQHVLTYATALAQITSQFQNYLKDYVISNRLEESGSLVVPGTEFDPYRIKAYSLDEKHASNYGAIKACVTQATKTRQWAVMLCHCVEEDASHVNVSQERFESFCKWLYDNYKDDIWFASFEDVSIYIEQHKHAKINYIGADSTSMTFNVTCDLDKNIYKFPMSFTVELPSFADSAYAIINGVEYDLELEVVDAYRKSVTIIDVPTDGTEVKIVLGGNKNCKNGCPMHFYSNLEVVKPTCTTRGYTERICEYCKHTYLCKFKPAEHDYVEENLTREEQREDGVYIITYRKCAQCTAERILKEVKKEE